MNAQLFDTVHRKDFLHFGQGPSFNPRAVVDFVGLKKQDVSKIAQVAPASVRYDEAIPVKVRERMEEIANVINMVADAFGGDVDKTALWFKTSNPLLGDVSPRDMIRLGRYDKLRKFIISAMMERLREAEYARKASRGEAA
jgi:uncharacterized protein (DUF2384 family)